MSILVLKLVLALIILCFAAGVSGCASAYLAARKEVIKSSNENRDFYETRMSIESRWGKPISSVVNEDGTVTCTYEYSITATPIMEPLDSLRFLPPGDRDLDPLIVILVESVGFSYYVVKDLAVRDRVRAIVTYNQDDIAVKDYHPPIEYFIPIPSYEVSSKVQTALLARQLRKAYVQSLVINPSFSRSGFHCDFIGPMQPLGGIQISDYIRNAFNKEFEAAKLYDPENGVSLKATLSYVSDQYGGMFVDAPWQVEIELVGNEGPKAIGKSEDLCKGQPGCRELAVCFRTAPADVFQQIASTPEFCHLLSSDSLSCLSVLEIPESVAKPIQP